MNLLKEAERYVTRLYQNEIPSSFEYHDLQHTLQVVHYSRVIGEEEKLSEEQMEALLLAAWFHDSGFARDKFNHEVHSVEIAREFLKDYLSEEKINAIAEAILSTRLPQYPQNQIARILCDADTYHLSLEEEFLIQSEKLKNEWRNAYNMEVEDRTFWDQTAFFINLHQYFTNYGKTILQPGKEYNQWQVREKIKTLEKDQKKREKKLEKDVDKLEKKLEKLKMPSRGIESMFRLTARNQINLSAIADNKANILISVNAIIISIVVTMLVRKFSEYPNIVLPSIVFLLTSLATVIFGILSTRPNVKGGRFTKEDVKQKKVNLLFFGNFYNMAYEDYEEAVKEMMKDYDGLYGNMIMDQYYLGRVLGKKYRLLRVAYTVFMFGFSISVITFIISAFLVPV
ncbi:MAG: DUF5706 domain-containing protein [Bacteroidales bacterium]|nr:DUF5706 domain-containing protein [Bacteroidales bacterium]MCF8333167.1 DUF5706 domain-containing protein [Bacteroidales bacterium]